MIALSGLITTFSEDSIENNKKLSPRLRRKGGGLATEFREDLVKWMPQLDGIAHSEGDNIILKIARDAFAIKAKGNISNKEKSEIIAPSKSVLHNNKLYAIYKGGRPKNLDKLPLPDWDLIGKDVNNEEILESYINTPIWGKKQIIAQQHHFMKRSLNTVKVEVAPLHVILLGSAGGTKLWDPISRLSRNAKVC